MGRVNPTALFGFFVAVIATICGASLLKGGFYLGKHEGDTFHLLQIVLRLADGQRPHLDFMTPIGVLAFAPMALLVKLGYGAGMAILLSQAVVSVLFLPAVWWIGISRMRGMTPYVFGVFVFVLIGALVHGEAQSSVSISMHYNRWAWAAAFVAITAAVLPTSGGRRHGIDGAIIGLAMAALALTKVTYFAAFFLPVGIALLLYRAYRTLFFALAWGALVALMVSLWGGLDYWLAYLVDILRVSASDIRAKPGATFGAVMTAPAYLGASLTLIFSVILLRQAEHKIAGLVLLLLTPGFFFVSYQNFGNDPQWLLLLVVLLLAFPGPKGLRNGLGWDMQRAVRTTAAVAFAFAAPSFFNLAYSPFRHLSMDVSDFTPILPKSAQHNDLFGTKTRAMRTNAQVPVPGEDVEFTAYAELADRDEATVFKGETLPQCQLSLGYSAWFQTISDDLEQAGLADGKSLVATDLFGSYWLFGPLEPAKGAAPWYYGGLPGVTNADYLLIPLCPIIPKIRDEMLKEVEKRGLVFTEIRRTPLYILLQRGASGS